MNSKPHHSPLLPLTRAGVERLKSGQPWLFSSHLKDSFKGPKGPALLPLGEHWFFWSPKSEIRLRRLGPASRFWPVDGLIRPRETIESSETFAELFSDPIEALLKSSLRLKKAAVGGDSCFRWLFSESDLLPGLVADVFGESVAVQIQTAAAEHFWPVLRTLLQRAFEEEVGKRPEIIELRSAPTRAKEGLPLVPNEGAPGRWLLWNGFRWWMRPGAAQKTGAYLDQRDNHRAAAEWARRLGLKEAWDYCCFEGGFSLHLLRAGLKVTALDQSKESLEATRRNAAENHVEAQLNCVEANVFDEIRKKFDDKEKTDLIILDPPAFLKNRGGKEGALRGLKELNLRALHCLRPGGLLVSCSCSHHISRGDFQQMLDAAAHDARRAVRILEVRGPAPDHAPLAGFHESHYLQAWYLSVE